MVHEGILCPLLEKAFERDANNEIYEDNE